MNLAKDYNDPWSFHGVEVEDNCPVFVTDYEQVLRLCKDIKITKSSGFKDIATRVFKDAFRVIVPQLVYLFNLSFNSGVFPVSWKGATIVPLHKGGDKTEVSNYRPVSLLPLPGKMIERIVHCRMTTFLDNHNVITEYQGGFRKGFSTAKSIADLTDNLFASMNRGDTSLAVFVDLRKAFDTVDHNILQRKLQCYGIRGRNLSWCKSYLVNREQRTLANGKTSKSNEIVCGVPQGSVLGPLFFILYVNDVQAVIKDANIQLYADDTVIYASGDYDQNVAAVLQPALLKFGKWCRENKLSLNAAKTKQMVFGTRQMVKSAKNAILSISDTPLQIVPTYKYLGITLDSTLSFNYHVKTVANMVSYKAVLLGKMRKFLNEEVSLKIYKNMIVPYFDYGDVIYGGVNQEGLEKLQRLQNKCLKICKGFHNRYGTKDLHTVTKMPMLCKRRAAHVNNFMFCRLGDPARVDNRSIGTRAHDAPLFIVKKPNLEAYKRSVEYAGAIQWNMLPPDIRNINRVNLFKERQKLLMG